MDVTESLEPGRLLELLLVLAWTTCIDCVDWGGDLERMGQPRGALVLGAVVASRLLLLEKVIFLIRFKR